MYKEFQFLKHIMAVLLLLLTILVLGLLRIMHVNSKGDTFVACCRVVVSRVGYTTGGIMNQVKLASCKP